jgi:DNA invertase Pin-like site-specific DNA recombinase
MKKPLSHVYWDRTAYVYVRQSTGAQILDHPESTKRQYGLAERARALGWSPTKICVIDEDQGKSGASAEGRDGFQRLVDAVVKGDAGAVLAIEVSRLSRSSEDWRRLLGLCGVAGVAVIDEQTVYDPSDPDDKLLLDLKGTMSEAELHWLRLRLAGARRQKARRCELAFRPATGYVWRDGGFALDPDEAVVRAIRTLFERLRVEPSVTALLRWAHAERFQMPTRRTYADGTTEVVWKPVQASRLYWMLHDPIYAGAYAYGRCAQVEKIVDGRIRRVTQREHDPSKWLVVKQDAHPGYITWKEYLHNQDKMRQNMARMGSPHRGAPREGPALLSGLLVCGRCGHRMTPSYSGRTRSYFTYTCAGDRDLHNGACWAVPGAAIDAAIEDLFLATMVPDELELCLAVEREVVQQASELDRAWHARIEQATYQARRAERRYKAVDPDNRVVARSLEREWEIALRAVEELETERERAKREKRIELSDEDRRQVRALAKDLPKVWRAKTTSPADRKAMLRIAIEAIGIRPVDVPRRVSALRVQWRSGQITELEVPRPDRARRSRTQPEIADRLRALAKAGLRDEQIADALNAEGAVTGKGKAWTPWAVKWARRREHIERSYADLPRRTPLPDRHPDGRYSVRGAAERLGVSVNQVRGWIKRGLVEATCEEFAPYSSAYWIRLDDATIRRLTA